jgi:hypothetical protein
MKNLRRLPKINNAINYLLKDNLKSKNLLINPKFNFTQFQSEEIKISDKEKKFFFPIKGIPTFDSGLFTVFEYTPAKLENDNNGEFQKLPQVPYEIKEHALKGFIYTFFLMVAGRALTNFTSLSLFYNGTSLFPFIPLGVFFYQYSSALWYMYNAVSVIRLKEDGLTVILEFKNFRRPIEVEIWRISKNKSENFFSECYSEPFLFPITLDYNDKYGEYSLFNKKTVYLYGDSHSCIKHGEMFRAILNSQSIKLK